MVLPVQRHHGQLVGLIGRPLYSVACCTNARGSVGSQSGVQRDVNRIRMLLLGFDEERPLYGNACCDYREDDGSGVGSGPNVARHLSDLVGFYDQRPLYSLVCCLEEPITPVGSVPVEKSGPSGYSGSGPSGSAPSGSVGSGSGSGPQLPSPCHYRITATLDWNTNADLDLYGQVTGFGVVFYLNTSTGGLTLNTDAHPSCAPTPDSPETITGEFTDDQSFRFWRNQFSACAPIDTPTTQTILVENLGGVPLLVNGQTVPIGGTWVTTTIVDAGYNTGRQDSFSGGTLVDVECAEGSGSFGSGDGSGSGPFAIPTDCCLNELPSILKVTVSNKTGTCTCLPDEFTIEWDGVFGWRANNVGTCNNADFTLYCSPIGTACSDFNFASTNCGFVHTTDATCGCEPAFLPFSSITLGGCCAGTADFLITPI